MKKRNVIAYIGSSGALVVALAAPCLAETVGIASFYGKDFHGHLAADGQPFNMNALTAAHRNLPFGTKLQVTNLGNGRSVVVRVSDRGPYVSGRVLDLSYGAACALDMVRNGTARIKFARL